MSVVDPHRLALVQVGGDGSDVTAIGRSVRGITWIDAARLHNWLAGRGSMDVPAHAPMVELDEGDVTTLRYWVKPRFQTARYAYHLLVNGTSRGEWSATIDGVTSPLPVGTRDEPIPATLYRDRVALSSGETELSIEIACPESVGPVGIVECVAVEAVPRTELLVANDLGVDRLNFRARQIIDEGSLSAKLLGRQRDLRLACRRTGLFQFSRGTIPFHTWRSTSSTPSNLFLAPFSLTGRKLFSGQTITAATKWRALAMCSNGTTEGQLVFAGGPTLTIPAGTTDWTWFTGDAFGHACEDNTTADGFPVGGPSEGNITLARTAGSGTVSVASVGFIDIGE